MSSKQRAIGNTTSTSDNGRRTMIWITPDQQRIIEELKLSNQESMS